MKTTSFLALDARDHRRAPTVGRRRSCGIRRQPLVHAPQLPTGLAYEPGSGNVFVIEQGSSGERPGCGAGRRSGGTVTTALTLHRRRFVGRARPSRHRLRSGLPAVTRDALGLPLLHADRAVRGDRRRERNLVVRYQESSGTLGTPEEPPRDPDADGRRITTAARSGSRRTRRCSSRWGTTTPTPSPTRSRAI